ncbi:FMN-binding protein [Lutispora saccharofermentans]|uniref:FMN-binding protein n=1 Tax=Lutispora saccharofermentans TaxID=3024236 RepID=A0ABT1NHA1_9FIRM|nr:FMN-binding protein [Lutispora saccharofermentans]MCQ1530546.1 FMN-binding protein [Lutispora saccharofermentans]
MKKRYIAIIIVLLVLALGFITTKILLTRFEGNLKQLALSEISDVDLAAAEDGIYIGSYSAFPVSAEVRVTIKNHFIVDIELLKHDNGQGQGAEIIPENVIEAQSLKADSVSGATYSSKVILKAIQNAILKAGG